MRCLPRPTKSENAFILIDSNTDELVFRWLERLHYKKDEIKSQPSHLWPLQQFKSMPIITNDERLVRWATSVLHTLYNPTSTTTVQWHCKKKILFQSFFYAKSQWHLVFINTVRNLSALLLFFLIFLFICFCFFVLAIRDIIALEVISLMGIQHSLLELNGFRCCGRVGMGHA